ncbi:hypothetical protein Q2941_50815 [Bradyrhizobium sp. UFLA05-153]
MSPFVQMFCGVGLPGSSQHVVALDTWWKLGCFVPGVLGERGKAILECGLLETTPTCHGALPLFE